MSISFVPVVVKVIGFAPLTANEPSVVFTVTWSKVVCPSTSKVPTEPILLVPISKLPIIALVPDISKY